MTREPCDHGITLASYREVCAECGVEVVHRPTEEPALRATVERLEGERDQAKDMLVGNALWAKTMQRNRELEAALRKIAALVEGQEGRTAQTMMMHGFSPVKALGQARDIARAALPDTEGPDDLESREGWNLSRPDTEGEQDG